MRERAEVFSSVAVSAMLIVTVRMSPTLLARWSLKKARAPGCQSELGWRSTAIGVGIGICTGGRAAAGFSIGLCGGGEPIVLRRSRVFVQPPRATESTMAGTRAGRLREDISASTFLRCR